MPWKNMPRNNWTKAEWYPVRFASRPTGQIFTLQQIFEKSWEYAKDVYTSFVDLEKAYDRVTREKLSGVFRENGVDDRLLLAVKSLCISAQKFLSLSAELNHNRSLLVLCCDKQGRIQWGSDRLLKTWKSNFFSPWFCRIRKKALAV